MQKASIILVGLSYTGKSSAGRIIARRLGWPFKDTDETAVSLAGGKPVSEIFSEWGEARFRGLERQSLGLACAEPRAVISTGGGAVMDAGNRALMSGSGVVFWLDTQPRNILARAKRSKGPVRPLLQAEDPLERLEAMRQERLPYYSAIADWVVPTDVLSTDEVVDEVLRQYGRLKGRLRAKVGPVPGLEDERPGHLSEGEGSAHSAALPSGGTGAVAVVSAAGGSYPIFVGAKVLNTLASRMRNLGLGNRAYVISDENVGRLHAGRVEQILAQGGFNPRTYTVPPGETSKELETVQGIYDWLTSERAERGHPIVALGGGVVGDMAGFAAATYLRGMPYVQAPTTLLAMVDASVGGKTGVNRPTAKNLVGSFYQPRMVLSDVELLQTLGERELTEGWAEVVKHALIRDIQILELMEARAEDLKGLKAPVTAQVIGASTAIKAEVVSEDERESGVRAILNYGHTIGHGIEAGAGYGTYLHGEAVAIGMMGAGRLSVLMGLLAPEELERQRDLLGRFGLPLKCSGVPKAAIKQAMGWDKKRAAGKQKWILLAGLGRATVRDDVPEEWVEAVLEELTDG